jgi:hypothetical protein
MAQEQATCSPQRALELLRGQRGLYAQLRGLAERQRSVISGDRPETVLDILAQRKRIAAALAESNAQLAPARRDWEATCRALSEGEREELSDLLAEINGNLQALLRSDAEDGALLEARKQSMGELVRESLDGRGANRAYALPPAMDGGAADLRG